MKDRRHFLKTIATLSLSILAAAHASADIPRVLMFAGHDVFHAATIPNAVKAFEEMAERHNFTFQWTQDKAFFSSKWIQPFDVLVLLSANPAELGEADRSKFQEFVNKGGSVVAIHAVIARGQWPWFDKLIGRQFIYHPHQQTAIMNVADREHSSALHFPAEFLWTDEFYVFGDLLGEEPHLILKADTSSYDTIGARRASPEKLKGAIYFGDYLPISWCHQYDGGRVFYTALGHRPALYKDRDFQDHIYGGLCWTLNIAQKGKFKHAAIVVRK